MTNVLIEGGAEVLGSFFDARAVDEVHVFIAPRIAGGIAKTAVAGRGVEKIADALSLTEWTIEELGPDVRLHGIVSSP
jgi:diaminohydroxyphosphoribosylaminopyrimidine deaminase/5-amino-6-(5-phosphoribosylamino)uracil reductase